MSNTIKIIIMAKVTGIVYDERMCLHEEADHPEQPNRIRHIYRAIKDEKLLELCKIIPIREATDTEILSVHSEKHLISMKKIPDMDPYVLAATEYLYNSVYFNTYSYYCALLSAGGVVELCDQVVRGDLVNGIAIVRPPGHHAECGKAMGFCLFNNVAIAAQSMINKYSLQKIVILDWDVHHGNATQHMFENDPRILYISIHRYDNGSFYPGSKDAAPSRIGIGNGIGHNVNIAWNTGDDTVGDAEYLYAFEKIISPMIKEYDPELIIVSAGFDCAVGDPLGGLHVTPKCFNQMTTIIMNYAKGKIVLALEGGYNLTIMSESMTECLKALLNHTNYNIESDADPSDIAISAVDKTINAHKPFWNFLND